MTISGAYSIQEGSKDVQHSLQNDPAEAHSLIELLEPVKGEGVEDGHNS